MVLATQNPIEYEGTFPLPEAQLDRFMLRVTMGYPPDEDELRIMRRRDPWEAIERLEPVLTADEVAQLQDLTGYVRVDDSLARYMLDVVRATREHEHIQLGASPRASVAYYETCQARALVEGRDYVNADDVKQMALPVLAHRVRVKSRDTNPIASARAREGAVMDALNLVPVPE